MKPLFKNYTIILQFLKAKKQLKEDIKKTTTQVYEDTGKQIIETIEKQKKKKDINIAVLNFTTVYLFFPLQDYYIIPTKFCNWKF